MKRTIQIGGILVLAAGSLWAADIEIGKAAYGSKCASCHAKDGQGNPAMAKVFKVEPAALNLIKKETLDKKDEELIKITRTGVNKMPAFKEDKLADADLKAVIAYMRALAPKN